MESRIRQKEVGPRRDKDYQSRDGWAGRYILSEKEK